ncbi:MAG: hypothetical protein ACRCZE_02850 [Candidatus Altimarinota bacterium]
MSVAQEQKPTLLQKLIIFNLIWSILGIIADWSWLSYIPFQLIPFTIICSLYPPLLLIIFLLIQKGKNPPQILLWLTSIGIISYGLAAQIYFPLLMSWKGFNLHDFGSMFWVAAYGLQFFLIKKYLRPLPLVQLVIIITYFLIVNSTHYFYPTFIDFILPNYPNWLKYTTAITVISLQILAIFFTWKVAKKNSLQQI